MDTPAAAPAPASAEQQELAADNARYREMRQALRDFEAAITPSSPPSATRTNSDAHILLDLPRHRAFYAALRSVLAQCVSDADRLSRRARMAAAHKWFTARRPREQPADVDAAAAMAASLSVSAMVSGGAATAQAQRGGTARSARGSSGAGGRKVLHSGGRHLSGGGEGVRPGSSHRSSSSGQRRQQLMGQAPSSPGSRLQLPPLNNSTGSLQRADSSGSSFSDDSSLDDPGGLSTLAAEDGNGTAGTADTAGTACSSAHPPPLRVPQPSISRQPAIHPEQRKVAPLISSEAGFFENLALFMGQEAPAADAVPGGSSAVQLRGLQSPSPPSTAGALKLKQQHYQQPPQQEQQPPLTTEPLLDPTHRQRQAGWVAACQQQRRFEADVLCRMSGYSRHRARIEEEIMRRQEARRLQQQRQQHQPQHALCAQHAQHRLPQPSQPPGTRAGRLLAHLDSQHQPPSTSAYVAAKAPGAAQRLVASDSWVRRARRAALAEGEREVACVAAALLAASTRGGGGGGGGNGGHPAAAAAGTGDASYQAPSNIAEALAHAMLPVPDHPHLTVGVWWVADGALLWTVNCAHAQSHKPRQLITHPPLFCIISVWRHCHVRERAWCRSQDRGLRTGTRRTRGSAARSSGRRSDEGVH